MTEKPHLDYRSRHAADSSSAAALGQVKSPEQPKTSITPHEPDAVSGEETVSVADTAGKTDEMTGALTAVEPSTVAVEKPAELPLAADKPAVKTAAERQSIEKSDSGKVYKIEVQDILSRKRAIKVVTHLNSMGCSNVRLQTVEKDLPMHRLFVAESESLSLAKKELKKVRKVSAGAFLLKSGGKYQLYAGSFRNPKNAVAEQKRLAAYGMKITIRDGIRIPTLLHVVTADVADGSSGEELLQQLKKRGFDATLNLSNRDQVSVPEPGIKSEPANGGDQDPDRVQINWLINELKRRGVNTSTIILDDESESSIDPDDKDGVLLSADMSNNKVRTAGNSLSR
jgi:hypothetical protein